MQENGKNTFVLETELDCPKERTPKVSGTRKQIDIIPVGYVLDTPGHDVK